MTFSIFIISDLFMDTPLFVFYYTFFISSLSKYIFSSPMSSKTCSKILPHIVLSSTYQDASLLAYSIGTHLPGAPTPPMHTLILNGLELHGGGSAHLFWGPDGSSRWVPPEVRRPPPMHTHKNEGLVTKLMYSSMSILMKR